ncbi:MAG: transposase domain-containing protein [Microbispora sp.]|nr:transposase domain-containing protein [Microbispora sp.]
MIYTIAETAKLNGLDPEAYIATVLDRMARGQYHRPPRRTAALEHPTGGRPMIGHPDQVDRLLDKIRAALPLPARMTPRLLATVQDQDPATPRVTACHITRVDYAGDEGGISATWHATAATKWASSSSPPSPTSSSIPDYPLPATSPKPPRRSHNRTGRPRRPTGAGSQ